MIPEGFEKVGYEGFFFLQNIFFWVPGVKKTCCPHATVAWSPWVGGTRQYSEEKIYLFYSMIKLP